MLAPQGLPPGPITAKRLPPSPLCSTVQPWGAGRGLVWFSALHTPQRGVRGAAPKSLLNEEEQRDGGRETQGSKPSDEWPMLKGFQRGFTELPSERLTRKNEGELWVLGMALSVR